MGFKIVWEKIKTNLIAILGVLLTISTLAARIFFGRYISAKRKAKELDARLDHTKKVMEKDNEAEKTFNSRRAAAKDEIKKSNYAPNLDDDWVRNRKK